MLPATRSKSCPRTPARLPRRCSALGHNMNELVVFGAGGHAREIIALVRDLNAARPPEAQWRLVGVLTDRPEWSLPRGMDLPRLGAIEWLEVHPACSVVVAVG